jgi:toxin ParE1/3/4
MKPVRFSPLAETDLVEIGIYIARDNPTRALSFIDELETKCDTLGVFPGMGVARHDVAVGLRMLPHGSYLIFYHEQEDHVRIERILHRARDVDTLLGE